jgi:hypothetical protein
MGRRLLALRVAPVPGITYEEVLLSLLNYCSRFVGAELENCCNNLISVLPLELEEEVSERFRRIDSAVRRYADSPVGTSSLVDRVVSENPELARYREYVEYLLQYYRDPTRYPRGRGLLKLRLVKEVLQEAGLLGLGKSSIKVGRLRRG